jgi:hypothetical protein
MAVTTTTSRERIAAAHAATDAVVTVEEKAPKAKKTPRDKFIKSLMIVENTLARLVEKLELNNTNRTFCDKLEIAQTTVFAAHNACGNLSADWSPRARKSPGVPSFIVGSVVSVRDKKREQAATILDEGELVGLTVVKIAGKIVRLVTPSGATVAAPRSWFRSDKKA